MECALTSDQLKVKVDVQYYCSISYCFNISIKKMYNTFLLHTCVFVTYARVMINLCLVLINLFPFSAQFPLPSPQ